jgi:hypothetical protein
MNSSYQIPSVLFDSIDPRWRHDILRFIDSGDASDEFLQFLDTNVDCQNVVEVAFTLVSQDVAATARQLEASARHCGEGSPGVTLPGEHHDSMSTTFARLFTHMLLTLATLDDTDRKVILEKVGSWLPAGKQHEVTAIVNGIGGCDMPWASGEDRCVS